MNIKRSDKVLIITGKDRGKTGSVSNVIQAKESVVIEGIGIYKKHIKPSKRNPQGGIIDVLRPIRASKVMVICPHCSKATRVGAKVTEKGKFRICHKCQESLDQE